MKPGEAAFLALLRAVTGQEWVRLEKPRGKMKANKPKETGHDRDQEAQQRD